MAVYKQKSTYMHMYCTKDINIRSTEKDLSSWLGAAWYGLAWIMARRWLGEAWQGHNRYLE